VRQRRGRLDAAAGRHPHPRGEHLRHERVDDEPAGLVANRGPSVRAPSGGVSGRELGAPGGDLRERAVVSGRVERFAGGRRAGVRRQHDGDRDPGDRQRPIRPRAEPA